MGKPANDARLVALMIRHSIQRIYTVNAPDFARYTEIRAITPDDVLAGTT